MKNDTSTVNLDNYVFTMTVKAFQARSSILRRKFIMTA
ncbi:hypothetical protein SAMN05421543_11568 [Alicyclobacillus macrosporangiidus]|uniref:Uncharacterized protein n=1 Tax=Alicyclobacillus macrosporangiidus TaxID=392015 RepID=A0A1I7KE98_9BACL|nr:hypothetical protein SAMN05421543_11568 [Alicyclobacillus macrosporangiidus]